MNAGVLGTGMVGVSIGSKLVQLGHRVKMGARSGKNEKAAAWAKDCGPLASQGTFADAAAFGEIVFLCTKGEGTLDAVRLAGATNLKEKVLVDITNPLDFSRGMPPSLFLSNTTSLSEEVQKLLPDALVVKTLNIVSCDVMVNPTKPGSACTMFVCGNSDDGKTMVRRLLSDFGWTDIIDLGNLTGARGMEMLLPLWVQVYMTTRTSNFGIKVVRPASAGW